MESEIKFEPFAQAERAPSPLPWAVYDAVDSRSGHGARLSVLWALEHVPAERMRAALDWFAEAGYQAQRLTSPCVPAVLSYRSTAEAAYVATDRPGGQSLRDRVEQGGPLAVANSMHISSLIAGVLSGAHAGGWPHGWLSPDTVWIQEDRMVAVTDLGLGLAAQSVVPGAPTPFPTRPGFFSADLMRRDMQCLGLILTLMLTGRLPDPVGLPRADIYPDDVPGGVVRRIRELINPQAEHPLTAAQWADFARVEGGVEDAGGAFGTDSDYYETPRVSSDPRQPRSWTKVAWGAGGIAALVALGLGGNALLDSRTETHPAAPPAVVKATEAPAANALVRVQVGPVDEAQVEPMTDRLRDLGFEPFIRRVGNQVYLQVGAFSNADSAQTAAEECRSAGMPVRVLNPGSE